MTQQDFPLVLKPKEVAQIMRVGQVKIYDIIRRPDFPKVMNGRNIIIPRDAFFRWLDSFYATTTK